MSEMESRWFCRHCWNLPESWHSGPWTKEGHLAPPPRPLSHYHAGAWDPRVSAPRAQLSHLHGGVWLADPLGFFGIPVSAPRNYPAPEPPALSAHCQPGITVTVGDGVESVVSDAIVVLEGCDVLWAAVVFPAAEIRALEDPCRRQRGHQLSRVSGTTCWLCLPGAGSRDLVLAPALTQTP